MKCPYCGHLESRVLDSRDTPDFSAIRRRRECMQCQKRFTTYERVELIDLVVIKKDGRRVPFDRNKIIAGIMKACEKRPVPTETIVSLVDEIEREVRNLEKTEVESRFIGEKVAEKLRSIDKVAYVRFASVYYEFDTVAHFEAAIKNLKKEEHAKEKEKT